MLGNSDVHNQLAIKEGGNHGAFGTAVAWFR
jgi:hypothetical protein